MRFAIEKQRSGGGIAEGTDFVHVADDKIIGSTRWLATNGRGRDSYHVLTYRDGKIIDMQGADRVAPPNASREAVSDSPNAGRLGQPSPPLRCFQFGGAHSSGTA